MKRIRFGRTGEDVSAVALGTWGHSGPNEAGGVPVGWSGHDDNQATAAIITAYENGINHFDTADVYGNGRAERLIGGVWEGVSRDEIFLATKVGWDKGEFEDYYHPALIQRHLEASLKNLKVDLIDLYYFHHCDFGPGDRALDDALEVMLRAKEAGTIRYIGLSDWDASKIVRLVDRVDPDVVQPYRNVVDDDYVTSGLKEIVDERDLGVAFFSPIKHGLLLGKYKLPSTFPNGDFRSRIDDFRDSETLDRYQQAASALEGRFEEHEEPILYGLVGALRADSPTASVLLGQRNEAQALAASKVGEALSVPDADWVRHAYRKK